MAGELRFYVTTVLICTGFALLLWSYPRWKIYSSIGFAGFVITGAVLVYLDGKEKEDVRTKIGQLERDLEDAMKEAEKHQSAAKDLGDEASTLGCDHLGGEKHSGLQTVDHWFFLYCDGSG